MAVTPGTALAQPPVVLLNTSNAITQKYIQPIIADSVLKPSPTYWRMTRISKKLQGGGAIDWPVMTAEELTGGAYYGAQVLDTSVSDSLQPAELQWRFYQQAVVIPYTDFLLNQGSYSKVVDLVKAKEETAMGSLMQKLGRAAYGVSPNNSSIDLDSIVSALASAGTYAGLTIGATGQWISNGGAQGPKNLGANLSLAALQTEYGNCTFGNEEPDTIITTQAGWNAYWNLLQPLQRFTRDEETIRGGFKNHLMFNNAVMLHDQYVPAGNLYGFTTKYSSPIFHEDDYFVVDPFIRPTNQRILVSQIFVTMNLRFLTLRQHFAITNISNA